VVEAFRGVGGEVFEADAYLAGALGWRAAVVVVSRDGGREEIDGK
jgi:hypothetical protein